MAPAATFIYDGKKQTSSVSSYKSGIICGESEKRAIFGLIATSSPAPSNIGEVEVSSHPTLGPL